MSIINLTPHEINIYNAQKELIISVPSSGQARVQTRTAQVALEHGIPLFHTVYGEVEGLPGEQPGDEVIIIVSLLVKQELPDRLDLFSPGELLRNEAGQPIGCIGLSD